MDNRNRITQNMLDNLIKRSRRKRLLRRSLALLSVVVLLFTMNTLKFKADTLERIPMCGLQEHTHGPECYSGEEATLVCSLQEHTHTDACYQQRPVKDGGTEEPSDEGTDLVSQNVDTVIGETDYDLSGAGLEGAGDPQEETAEQLETLEQIDVPTYALGEEGFVALSKLLEKTGLPVALDQVEMVGTVDNGDDAAQLVSISQDGSDYVISALSSFDSVELAVITAEEIYTIQLTDAIVSAGESEAEQTEVGNNEGEPAEEQTEETTEDAAEEEQTEEVSKVTTEEEQTEEAPEETAEEEQTEEAPEETAEEEQTEEASEETAEEEQTEEVPEVTTEEQTEVTSEETTEEEQTEEAPEETTEEEQTEEAPEETAEEEQSEEAPEDTAEETTEEEQTGEAPEETAEVEQTEEAPEENTEEEQTEEESEETTEEEQTEEATEETAEETAEEEQTEEAPEETTEEEQTEEASEVNTEEVTEEEASEEQTEEETVEEETTEEETAEEETAEEEQTEEATEEEQTEEASEETTEEEQSEKASEEASEEDQTEEATEEPTDEEQAEEATEETVEEETVEEEATKEETAEEEPTEEENAEKGTTEEAAARIETVYTATIDLSQVESYPLSLRELMDQAVATVVEDSTAEDEVEPTEEAAGQTEEEPAEDSVETTEAIEQTEVVFTLDYDAELLTIEKAEDDHLVTPVAAFESAQIIVNNGSRYELTLINYTPEAGEEPAGEPGEEAAQAETVYTATIDLSQVESYPLSLREMMAQAVATTVETPVEASAQKPSPDGALNARESVQWTDSSETGPVGPWTGGTAQSAVTEEVSVTDATNEENTVEQTAEETAEPAEQTEVVFTLDYDAELLTIEKAEDDHLVTPVAAFESAQIIVNNGSRYELMLVNCAFEAEEAGQIAHPAQAFEGSTEYVRVSVNAPEGAFPEGTTMVLADVVDDQIISGIEQTVGEDFVQVERVHAVDITFLNAEKQEIEPLVPISVVMGVPEIDQAEEAVVVHVDNDGAAQIVDSQADAPAGETEMTVEMPAAEDAQQPSTDAEATAADEAPAVETPSDESAPEGETGETLSFEADSFSVYAVVVTRTIETRYIDAKGETWNISVGYGQEAGIPVGATLSVRELSEAEQAEYYARTAYVLQDRQAITLARFFDISILDADGNEVQPEGPVEVRAELADATEDDVKAVHFAETGMEMIEANRDAEAVCFDAEGFSVYGIVFTVDFRYEVNGKVYEFSLPGGGFVSFTELVEMLGLANAGTQDEADSGIPVENEIGIAAPEEAVETGLTVMGDSDAAKQFVADVELIEFSTPALVSVSKVEENTTVGAIKDGLGLVCEYSAELTEEQIAQINATEVEGGDWALISLKPFLTEEYLIVTMKDGETFTILVTDGQLHTYVISDSGDTYEVIVTYDDRAEIPEGAELVVKEIKADSKKFAKNVELVNEELIAVEEAIVSNPAQFDISIVADGEVVEPKIGSEVKVEVRLAKTMFEKVEAEESDADVETEVDAFEDDESLILLNGQVITNEEAEPTGCRVMHITESGAVEIIDEVKNTVTEDEYVMEFVTESFSDYLYDTDGQNQTWTCKVENLPDVIYVGDEIYMYDHADMWVTNIGSTVLEIKHPNGQNGNYGSKWKTVVANEPGRFGIGPSNEFNNGAGSNNYKWIQVLSSRTGTTPPQTISTIDNASIGLTLNLFDYDLDNYLDDYYNNYNHPDNPVANNFLYHGINNGHNLKFWGSGIGDNHGYQNQYQQYGVSGIVQTYLDTRAAGGYPVLMSQAGGDNLSYLFTPENGTDKKAYTGVNGLFKRDGDYYVYDSNQNYAWYNPSTNSFEVYNTTYEQKSRVINNNYSLPGGEQATITNGKPIGFFPFHRWDNEYDQFVNWNKSLNHHFGLSMSVDFNLPQAPKAVEDSDGHPIVFEFSGDDDLWVFIDGKLVMDIGGVHQPISGTINFADHTVTVNGSQQMNRTIFDTRFPDLYDGKNHTMQVFYIERGGCDSNCKIKFNMTRYGDVECDKVDEETKEKLAGAVFGIYKDQDCTQPLKWKKNDGTFHPFVAIADENGHVKFEGVPLGDYYLKEIAPPAGYPDVTILGSVKVRVDEQSPTKIKVTLNGAEVGNGHAVNITNKQPKPIKLGLKKVWQNEEGTVIVPETDATKATFELKRIRTHGEYNNEQYVNGSRNVSKLIVGWIHDSVTHDYREYELIVGTQTTVSWNSWSTYMLNGASHSGTSCTVTIPASGQTTKLYIVDDSANGDGITNITVTGWEFRGNSAGGYIRNVKIVSEHDTSYRYSGDQMNVTNNRVTLSINNSWEYSFEGLPTFEKVENTVYNYSYYLEEIGTENPASTAITYVDTKGQTVSKASDTETSVSGTEIITNTVAKVNIKILKVVKGTNTPLSGAEFTLTRVKADHTVITNEGTETAKDQKIETTDATTGELKFSNLMPGCWYRIEETGVPAGFIKKEGPYYVYIDVDGTGTLDTSVPHEMIHKIDDELIIENEPGARLPSTGGMGTIPFTVAGGLLALLALALLLRRREAE